MQVASVDSVLALKASRYIIQNALKNLSMINFANIKMKLIADQCHSSVQKTKNLSRVRRIGQIRRWKNSTKEQPITIESMGWLNVIIVVANSFMNRWKSIAKTVFLLMVLSI